MRIRMGMGMRIGTRVAPLTTNSCTGASARLASSLSRKPVSALVAYLATRSLDHSEVTVYTHTGVTRGHSVARACSAPPLVAVGLDDGALVEERAVVLVVLL